MNKDEARLSVMGAISMALKDSTLQQGFEIICKNLSEVEKENAELKDEIYTWKKASSTNSYKAFRLQEENKTHSKHILELQKDKGELTDKCRKLEAQIEKMKVCQNCDNWNWKHNKCEKKLKGDCFKHSKWVMRNF